MNRWSLILVLTLLLGSGWVWVSRVPPDQQSVTADPAPAVGHPAPDFTLTTLDGETFQLSDLQGTPVVLNFWATWCGPCQRELPALQAATERFAGRVVIAGVDQGEEAAVVQSYVDDLGLTFVIPMDENFEVSEQYAVLGLPTTFFIDADGIIRQIWSGEMNSITLAEGITALLLQ